MLFTESLHNRYILLTKANPRESTFLTTAHEQIRDAANDSETSRNKRRTCQLSTLTDIRGAPKERDE